MLLQTQIPIQRQKQNLIDYNSKILLLGSCFSENIGNKLSYYKFQTSQNPYGILFHPKAIEKLVDNVIQQKEYTEDDIFFHNERWHCFDTHSNLSATTKQELIDNLNQNTASTFEVLQKASHVIITLGTAWIYKHINSGNTVANCHKISQKEFSKEILSIDEIQNSLQNICSLISSLNPNATLIFTVSPVRHIKDGFIENQRSKAHLVSAIHQLKEKNNSVRYFPSYEIMMDELRDYRFYKEDMIHPNQTAIHYIWEKFTNTWFSKHTIDTMQKVEEIQKGLAHKPFNPNSEAHQKFLKKLAQKKETLIKVFPHMSF